MAICDHNYKFIMCDIGASGRQSDGGIFRHSTFGQKFFSNSLPYGKSYFIKFHLKKMFFFLEYQNQQILQMILKTYLMFLLRMMLFLLTSI